MDVLQHYNLTRFMNYVPRIKKATGEWYIVEVSLIKQANHNAAYIAMKLRDYFDTHEGVIFICNSQSVLVLAHMGKDISKESISDGVHKNLPRHNCTTRIEDMTLDGLIKIQVRLEEIEQNNKAQPDKPLFQTRQKRRENIVMIVDDDMFMRSLVNKTFMAKNRIVEFKSTDGVLESYLEHLPDIVFLDIHLPDGSGIVLLSDILRFDDTAHVVIMSSDSVINNIVDCKELGAKNFIAKPFTLAQLESSYRKCSTINA
ncbi:MAG: response regulator [Micavibrio sp.]|nr:response regulator [Micavibrio sp.]